MPDSSSAMQSDNEASPESGPPDGQKTKKRRLHGACDMCRKKKVKCDSAEMLGRRCTNCQISDIDCTHDAPRQLKKSEARAVYIQSLEEQVRRGEKMYRLLQKVYPGEDIDQLLDVIPDEPADDDLSNEASSNPDTTLYTKYSYPVPPQISNELKASRPTQALDDHSEVDDLGHIALTEHLNRLNIRGATDDRYFGQASVFMFTKDASNLKSEITGSPPDGRKYMRQTYWTPIRQEVEFITAPQTPYIYPEANLLQDLVHLYFEKSNPFIPLLHKPTFLKSLMAGQHHWDQSFGMTVLLVCALGARYSHDPRVLVPGAGGLSSGWQYFCQVPVHRHSQFYRNTVHDLQYYVLASIYILGIGVPHVAWSIMGMALRCAMEKGAHRRKPDSSKKPTADEESLKRAFWCLVFIDRIMCMYLGRPHAVQDEDFDVDYPIECDDEYWEIDDPDQAFRQPPGKPSIITGFVYMLKLFEILAFALRTLYSTKKSKILSGLTGNEWESRIVAELDSSMNKWKDSLPHFLCWDPEMRNPTFFHQSVYLHVAYHYIQIQIHRPFLTKKSSLSFPSLAMCTNAARSCAHVLEVCLTRGTPVNFIIITGGLITGTAISLILWGNKRSGMIGDPGKDIANFQICLNVMKECEKRWYVGGRAYDMLNEVSFLNEYKSTVGKRRRDSPEPTHQSSGFSGIPSSQSDNIPFPSSSPNYLPSINVPPNNSYNISSSVRGNEPWDFTNLMFAHMGFVQPDLNGTVAPQYNMTKYAASPASTSRMGVFPIDYSILDMQDIGQGIGRSAGESSDFSLWSEIPIAFSADEWNKYLANLGNTEADAK